MCVCVLHQQTTHLLDRMLGLSTERWPFPIKNLTLQFKPCKTKGAYVHLHFFSLPQEFQ